MNDMKIGEIARRSGVGIETIRFYEREGLLLEPQRRPSGYRQYDESTLERLQYIGHAKSLGFTLAEIRELMELSFNVHGGCCSHIQERVQIKISDIENKIRSLQKMRRSLGKILKNCKNNKVCGSCPLVHDLNRKQPQ